MEIIASDLRIYNGGLCVFWIVITSVLPRLR